MKLIKTTLLVGLSLLLNPIIGQAQEVLSYSIVGGGPQGVKPTSPQTAQSYFQKLVLIPLSKQKMDPAGMGEATERLGEQVKLQASVKMVRISPKSWPGDIFRPTNNLGLYAADAQPQDVLLSLGEVTKSKSFNLTFVKKEAESWGAQMLEVNSNWDGFMPEGQVSRAFVWSPHVYGAQAHEDPEEEDIQMITSPDGNIYVISMDFQGPIDIPSTTFLVKLIQ